jgi:hypothetical protein
MCATRKGESAIPYCALRSLRSAHYGHRISTLCLTPLTAHPRSARSAEQPKGFGVVRFFPNPPLGGKGENAKTYPPEGG